MREAVIVSYARTGLAKSGRGGFNITPPMSMAAHAIKHAVERSGVEKDFVEDCYLGNNAHGAANIGRRPTVNAGPESRLEVNLFDFAGDLYGQDLAVALHAFLRPEQKFSGLDELRARIAADCIEARRILDLVAPL